MELFSYFFQYFSLEHFVTELSYLILGADSDSLIVKFRKNFPFHVRYMLTRFFSPYLISDILSSSNLYLDIRFQNAGNTLRLNHVIRLRLFRDKMFLFPTNLAKPTRILYQ